MNRRDAIRHTGVLATLGALGLWARGGKPEPEQDGLYCVTCGSSHADAVLMERDPADTGIYARVDAFNFQVFRPEQQDKPRSALVVTADRQCRGCGGYVFVYRRGAA